MLVYSKRSYCFSGMPAFTMVMKSRGLFGPCHVTVNRAPALTSTGPDTDALTARTAMRRVSEHWVHNVAQGARCEAAALTAELAGIAEAAAAALELDYAGVDLMPANDGAPVQVIEVNGVAAWQGLQRVTPFNIAATLVADLIDRKLAAAGAERRA